MNDPAPSNLARVLQAGHFAMTAETSPPDSSSAQTVLDRVACLKNVADADAILIIDEIHNLVGRGRGYNHGARTY